MSETDKQIALAKLSQHNTAEDKHVRNRYLAAKVSLGVIFIFLCLFLYLLLWPFKVTELDNIIISTDPVNAGQYQRYTAQKCDDRHSLAEVSRSLVFEGTDESPVATPDHPTREVKCSNIILLPVTLPNADYEIRLDFKYKVNPIRDALNPVTRTFRSKAFTVKGGRDIQIPSGIAGQAEPNDNKNEGVKDATQPGSTRYDDKTNATPPEQQTTPTQPADGSQPQSYVPQTPSTAMTDPLTNGNPPGLSDIFNDNPDAGGLLGPFFTLPLVGPLSTPLQQVQDTLPSATIEEQSASLKQEDTTKCQTKQSSCSTLADGKELSTGTSSSDNLTKEKSAESLSRLPEQTADFIPTECYNGTGTKHAE